MNKYKIQPTERQKKAADNIIKQKMTKGIVNKGKALKEAGFSDSVSKTPKLVTESKGFLAYMEEAGLTDESLATFLAEDIKAKPRERLGELKLAFELKGLKKDTVDINVQKSDEALALMKEIIDGDNKEEKED